MFQGRPFQKRRKLSTETLSSACVCRCILEGVAGVLNSCKEVSKAGAEWNEFFRDGVKGGSNARSNHGRQG